jgi:hypothetical protein
MRSGQIVVLVAVTALLRSHSVATGSAPHVHVMLMTIISLPREVAARMAIHAPRMPQDRDESSE